MGFDVEQACAAMLESLEHEAFGGRFHLSGTSKLPALSSWASAHAALAMRHLDPAYARDELQTLYEACQHPDGLLARERSLDDDEVDGRSPFIDPPVSAYAVARMDLDGQLDGPDLLERATRQVDAIWGERLPPDTSLPVILHPSESAVPSSPCFGELVDWAPGPEWQAEAANLARSALGCQLDPARALRAGHPFVVEDPVFCGWLLIALEELGRAWDARENPAVALKLRVRSSMIREAVEERLWWPVEEIYTAFDRARGEPLRAISGGGLVPACSTTLLEEGSAKRVVDRHLRPNGSTLWTTHGLCLNPVPPSRASESLRPGEGVSPLAHYWAHLALVRAGRQSDARVARTQLETLLESHGFFGLYDPASGEGRSEPEGSLGVLVLDMRDA